MTKENMIAYSEVDEILNLLDGDYKNKVPEKIRNFFKDEKNKDYKVEVDLKKPLIEQNLKRETFIILATLYLNYWCKNEEEKQAFLREMEANEIEKKELLEQYNLENLCEEKNSNLNDISNENVHLVKYDNTNFFKKLLLKIVNFFRK